MSRSAFHGGGRRDPEHQNGIQVGPGPRKRCPGRPWDTKTVSGSDLEQENGVQVGPGARKRYPGRPFMVGGMLRAHNAKTVHRSALGHDNGVQAGPGLRKQCPIQPWSTQTESRSALDHENSIPAGCYFIDFHKFQRFPRDSMRFHGFQGSEV